MEKVCKLLLYGIVFFIPYTTFKVTGLKISEFLTILFVISVVSIYDIKLRYNNFVDNFIHFFSVLIFVSAIISFIDPINEYVRGIDNGLYYSFEYGWIFRIFRFYTVLLFTISLEKLIKTDHFIFANVCYVYMISCCLLDIYAILIFFLSGMSFDSIGMYRTSLAAIEPSEAGYINCYALIIGIFFYLWNRNVKMVLCLFVLMVGQLVIGSTASVVAMFSACTIVYLYYLIKRGLVKYRYIGLLLLFCMVTFGVIYVITEYTHIFDKFKYVDKSLETEGSSVVERLTTINTCFAIFKERPIFGIGWGNFGWYVKEFVTSPFLIFVPGGNFQPNNLYMQLLAEVGAIGFLLYIWFTFKIIERLLIRRVKRLFQSDYYRLFLLTLLFYILIHNLTLTTIYSFQYWIIIAFVESMIHNQKVVRIKYASTYYK